MEGTTSLWIINGFIVVALCWFYLYFYTMFEAIAKLNDDLITIIKNGEEKPNHEGQTTLDDYFTEEE